MTDRGFRVGTLLVYILGIGALTAAVLAFCDGHFVYTLDDPYIHLALAETIARGGYGINLGEYASPSSSILFPFLLSPFAWLGIERLAPFAIGVASGAASTWILAGFFHRHVIAGGAGARSWLWLLTIPLLLVAVNAVALPFVGLEHPLHVLAAVLTMTGLVRWAETGRIDNALRIGVVLGPLLRFEGLALSGAVLLVLLVKGRARAAVALSGVLALVLAAYALFMHAHGLPLVPSSVLVKSTVSASAMDHSALAAIKGLAQSASIGIKMRQGTLLMVACILLMPALQGVRLGPIRPAEPGASSIEARAVVAFVAIAAMAAHLLLGTYGWFGRYEVYVFAIMLLAVCYVWSEAIRAIEPVWLRIVTLGLALALMGFSFGKTLWNTPAAARNVYQQQWQMHRFAAAYFPHAVAVNDIGAVSYRNDAFVLDLWGLGSEEVRQMRKARQMTPDRIAALARRRGVAYAMIYDSWFTGAVPASWQLVAHLTTSRVMSGGDTVTIYLTQPSRKAEMLAALRRFGPTLPAGASLAIMPAR